MVRAKRQRLPGGVEEVILHLRLRNESEHAPIDLVLRGREPKTVPPIRRVEDGHVAVAVSKRSKDWHTVVKLEVRLPGWEDVVLKHDLGDLEIPNLSWWVKPKHMIRLVELYWGDRDLLRDFRTKTHFVKGFSGIGHIIT